MLVNITVYKPCFIIACSTILKIFYKKKYFSSCKTVIIDWIKSN